MKQKASKRHESEKDHMATMNAFGIATAEYSCDTALEGATGEENVETPDDTDELADDDVNTSYLLESCQCDYEAGKSP